MSEHPDTTCVGVPSEVLANALQDRVHQENGISRIAHSMKINRRPDSPCIGLCSNLFDDICRGCGRSAQEVYEWITMTDEQKEIVWKRIILHVK